MCILFDTKYTFCIIHRFRNGENGHTYFDCVRLENLTPPAPPPMFIRPKNLHFCARAK